MRKKDMRKRDTRKRAYVYLTGELGQRVDEIAERHRPAVSRAAMVGLLVEIGIEHYKTGNGDEGATDRKAN